MTNPNNGGPAFPCMGVKDGYGRVQGGQKGMTLRDYFAAQAPDPPDSWLQMQLGIDKSRNPYNEPHKPAPRDDFQLMAEWKFAYADAMLRAREE